MSVDPHKTPSREATPSTHARIAALQATPGSQGLAANSDSLTVFDANTVQNLLKPDLQNFEKASFKYFLHYALSLVEAVPKRDSVPKLDVVDAELKVCLDAIIGFMNNQENESMMNEINEQLRTYCGSHPEGERYGPFVKAANSALLLLQPLIIRDSEAAVKPDSEDFLLFMRHDPAMVASKHKGGTYRRKPDVSYGPKGNIMHAYAKDLKRPWMSLEDLLEAVALKPERPLEWKKHHGCAEMKLNIKTLEISQPVYNAEYAAAPLKEYGHTEKSEITWEALEDYGSRGGPGSKSAGSNAALKRTASRPASAPFSKRPRTNTGSRTSNMVYPNETNFIKHLSGAEQCAEDAAEMLYNTFGRDHVVNFAINDELIRVWYFDHESPIQTSGFNFIEDIPYFLLFLFALQRFSPTDWGYIEQLSPVNADVVKPVDLSKDLKVERHLRKAAQFNRSGDPSYKGYRRFSLGGRATHVIYGNITAGGVDYPVAFKLSWREQSRTREGAFLEAAKERLLEKEYGDVCDYLPTLLAEREFPELSTDNIRSRLNITVKDKATRLPYFVVLPKYEPISVRTKDWSAFFDDFLALMYGHCMLWSVGIEHRDISEANLMWDPRSKKPKLCDFDLSHFSTDQGPTGFTNTGTWMFMAIDLLKPKAMQGNVKRLYRHDVESFIAVLVWILFRYRNGVLLANPPLGDWNTAAYQIGAVARQDTYEQFDEVDPPEGIPPSNWLAVRYTASQFATISGLSAEFRLRLTQYTDKTLTASVRERYKLSPEEEKKLECFDTIVFITEVLKRGLFDSDLGPELANKIKTRLGLE